MTDVNPGTSNFWADDHLKRSEEASYLTNYLAARYQAKKHEMGFVLAINGDWGLGKSFMIDRWSKDLQQADHPVVMFNSWENDFTSEPLLAFIAELNSAMSSHFDKLPQGEELRREWLATAKFVLVPTLKFFGMAALKHTAGLGINEAQALFGVEGSEPNDGDENDSKFSVKEIGEKLAKVIEDELKSHSNVKQAITDFKQRLSILVSYLENQPSIQLPIFVFIDELDRCRPDYAIKLLEGIKHLFGIPGIHFIVATNLAELAHSVRAVYGEKFSAERYLKRFFDMEYTLPEPEGLAFAAELMTPLSVLTEAKFVTGFQETYRDDEFPAKNLSFIFCQYAKAFALRLRDQKQACKILEASLLTLGNTSVHIHFLIFLVCLYQKDSQLYRDVIRAGNLGERTGFLIAAPEIGSSQFPVYDSSVEGSYRSVSILTIGELYFSIISGNQFLGRTDYGFPNNLALNARSEQHKASLASYTEIVRRAGRFSK
jgi:hypothetical protein